MRLHVRITSSTNLQLILGASFFFFYRYLSANLVCSYVYKSLAVVLGCHALLLEALQRFTYFIRQRRPPRRFCIFINDNRMLSKFEIHQMVRRVLLSSRSQELSEFSKNNQ